MTFVTFYGVVKKDTTFYEKIRHLAVGYGGTTARRALEATMDCEKCGGDNGVPMATGQGVQSLCASCRCSIPPAPPSKPKSPADELRDLVAVMREMGVTEYERGDVKLKLGAAKVESPPITDAQRRAMAEETKKQHDALLYASSEGFPVDEEGQPA